MLRSSIRLKLTIWYSAVMALVLVLFSIALYITMETTLSAEVDAKIKAMAEVTAKSPTRPQGHFNLVQLEKMLDERLGFKTPGKFIQILDNTGTVGQTSANLHAHPLPISLNALRRASAKEITFETIYISNSRYPVRVVTYPIVEDGEVTNIVQLGTSLQTVRETMNKLFLTLLFGIPGSLFLAGIGGWIMAKASLKPVTDITQAARRITAENLEQKIEVSNQDDEVGRLADTMNEMISRLNNSFKQIRQFSSDVSHELRTPLTVMRGEMEVALRSERSPDEYRDVIASSLEEAERLSRLVEELLLLSKSENGEMRLRFSDVPLHKLLRRSHDYASVLAQGKEIRVTIDKIEDVHVIGDEMRLWQLLLNIVDNAVKYSHQEGIIELSLTRDHDRAYISVKDTGIGISEEDSERIFERFYRADKARSREVGGTGLGLSICKWIAEAHGGDIVVESEPGKGSSFTITLPLHPPGVKNP